jgi:hypothetical protein
MQGYIGVPRCRRDTVIDCKMADDKSAISFDFSMPFEIHDDSEILKRLNMNQYISAVTSAPGRGLRLPHLHRDWARVPARAYHICTGTVCAPATS